MNVDNLLKCPICAGLQCGERENLLATLDLKTAHYKKGEYIARQGDSVKSLYILQKGSVRTEMISEAGTVLNIETLTAPKPLASAFLFAENNRFPVDVIALEDCELTLIPKKSIMQQLAGNEKFLQHFMTFNANRAQFLSERLKFLSIKTIKGKLAQYILGKAVSGDFLLDRNREELADYFGVARPSLSRSLAEIIDDGIISLKGKQGKILNLSKLRALSTQ